MKFKVGGRRPAPAEDAARVLAAREALGPDAALMVDANQGWDRADAVDFGRRVADLGIRWFEESRAVGRTIGAGCATCARDAPSARPHESLTDAGQGVQRVPSGQRLCVHSTVSTVIGYVAASVSSRSMPQPAPSFAYR